jgi:hypothetical protein
MALIIPMKKVILKIAIVFAILWSAISLLYLLAGLLIILHSEEGIIALLKKGGDAEIISAIAAVSSAIAAFMSYSASNKAAEAAARSNIIACLPERIRTRDALSIIWNYLNKKSCIQAYNTSCPHAFLVSKEEIKLIQKQKEAIWCSSASYDEYFHRKVTNFYTYMESELSAQQKPCDFEDGIETLSESTQDKYKSFRVEETKKAFALLQEASHLMHRQP